MPLQWNSNLGFELQNSGIRLTERGGSSESTLCRMRPLNAPLMRGTYYTYTRDSEIDALRDCGGDIFLVFCLSVSLSLSLSHFPYTRAATSDENVLKRFSSAGRREGMAEKVVGGCKERENEGERTRAKKRKKRVAVVDEEREQREGGRDVAAAIAADR